MMKNNFLIIVLYHWYIGIYIGISNGTATVTKKNNGRCGNLHIAPFILFF
jgi:hypothetical protein